MKIQIKQSVACLLLASLVPLQANAANVAWTGDIDSNWTTGGNWSTNTAAGSVVLDNADFSGSGDNAIVDASLLSYRLNQVRVSDGASLTINEPFSINNAMQLGAVARLGGGTIFQHADTNIAASLRIGHLTTINTPSSYVVDEGTLTVGTQIFIRNGSFEIDSTKPTVSAFNMRVFSAGEVIFDLGPQGVSPLTLSSDLRIDSGAKIVVDLSDYTQGADTIELINFASIRGNFSADNISIIGLEGGTLNYTDTSLTLTINEPKVIVDSIVKGLWNFDNISGNSIVDDSGYSNDATLLGPILVTGSDAFKISSLDFDGENDTISLPSSAFTDISDEITLAMWTKADVQSRNDILLLAENSEGEEVLKINFPASATRSRNSRRGSSDRTTSTSEDEWNHWVFVKNANTGIVNIYANGELYYTLSDDTNSMSGITNASIGSASTRSYYDGKIDDLILYNVALSAAEVTALYEEDASNSDADEICDPRQRRSERNADGSCATGPIGYQNEAWFALSAQACIGQNSDLAINNGSAISDLNSDDLTCTQATSGNDMIYSVDWQGSDFDRDGTNDILTFDVRVEGFTGSTYSYSATAGESSMTALGASSPVTSDASNNFWDVEDNGVTGVGAGQSLRFSVENINVSTIDYNASMNGFNYISLIETGGNGHRHIRGEGTGLDSSSFNNNNRPDYSFLPQEQFVITGAGDGFSHLLGSINQIQFSLSISNPELTTPLGDYDFSLYGLGPDLVDVYPASDVSRQALYPEFSWDTVPRWLAVRNTDAYTDEQIETIAGHYQLVMLEKANNAGLANNDEGIKETSRRLKEINPNITTLFYWNSVIFYSGYSNDEEYEDNVNEWSLLNDDGSLFLFRDLFYNYNNEVKEMRDWWVELPTTIVTDDNIDGVFIDKVTEAAFDEIFVDGEPANAYVDMLNQLYEKMPKDKITVGNVLRGERNNSNRALMELFDGSYLERWDFPGNIQFPEQTKADAIALSIQLMREALAQGKLINFQTNPHTDEPVPDTYTEKLDYMARHVDFPLAVFLMAAEENAFFSYQLSVNGLPRAGEGWDSSHIEELNRPLGEPLSGAIKDGYIYTRSFEYVDVWLDLQTEEAILTWRDAPANR